MVTSTLQTSEVRFFSRRSQGGFTVVEIAAIILVISILAGIGYRVYVSVVDRARVVQATGDIRSMSFTIDDYFEARGTYPERLSDLNKTFPDDPWGNPYGYLALAGTNGDGKARKDHNLVPLNTDYDLYSSGPDGKSASPLTAKASRDDIVRANNGGFVGLAESY